MKYFQLFAILVLSLLASLPAAAGTSSSETFDAIMKPYEDIRLILLNDSVEGIVRPAEAIREAAGESKAAAGEVGPLLPEITASADQLAAAGDVATAREAFYALSKILVQYRSKISGDDLPLVMYCPMAKRSWLQLEEKVGNPYQGKAMGSCGEVVEE